MNRKSAAAIVYIFFTIGMVSAQIPGKSSAVIDLSGWKLQVPGPREITILKDYSSEYFYAGPDHSVCFNLNAADRGTTKNAEFVRSELRHLQNWSINECHVMEGEVRVDSGAEPDKVTVAQIHSIKDNGDTAFPLLRLALNNGNLIAFIKRDNSGEKTESFVLRKKVSPEYFSYRIEVTRGILKISVNGDLKISKDLSYWKYKCYFKAGCYPQAAKGIVQVYYKRLSVYK